MKIKIIKTTQIEEEYDLKIGDMVEFTLNPTRHQIRTYAKGIVEYISKSGRMFITDTGGNCCLHSVDSIFKINNNLSF
jgi:hypothetical protein